MIYIVIIIDVILIVRLEHPLKFLVFKMEDTSKISHPVIRIIFYQEPIQCFLNIRRGSCNFQVKLFSALEIPTFHLGQYFFCTSFVDYIIIHIYRYRLILLVIGMLLASKNQKAAKSKGFFLYKKKGYMYRYNLHTYIFFFSLLYKNKTILYLPQSHICSLCEFRGYQNSATL